MRLRRAANGIALVLFFSACTPMGWAQAATPSKSKTIPGRNRMRVDGQGLRLAGISEARASASVSIYSRMFVNLPFRTVMAKTQ